MPETISYPGRDALGVMAAQVNSVEPERRPRAYLARSIRAALDTHAHDLDALARRLDVHDQQIAALQADACWKGHAAGRNYGGPTPQAAPALPAWVTETTPCAACPEDIKHEHDDNGWTDDDGDHRGHAFEAEPVHAIAVTFYVAAPQDLDADTIRAMFGAVLDHSTAREALAAGLDGADPRVTLLGVTDPTAPAR